MKQFLKWLTKPNPDTTLVKLWRRKRAKDREKVERERPAKIDQRVEAEAEYRENIKREAYLLWEADGKPVGKDNYYWTLAIDKITGRKVPTIYKPYYWIEKSFLEPADKWISRQAFFTILGNISNLAIVVAVVAFIFGGEKIIRNSEVFAAWTAITTAGEQSGSGGRIEALEFLNSRPWRFPYILPTETRYLQTREEWFWDEEDEECKKKRLFGRRWERQPLDGLSAPNAYLEGIVLCGAKLQRANLQEADLRSANLPRAKLFEADLQEASLTQANLQGANLVLSNFQRAKLFEADLQEADLRSANFQRARLWQANLQEVKISAANLQEAELRFVNLQGADLTQANLQQTHLSEVKGLMPEQIKQACFWDEAIYKAEYNFKKGTLEIIEPDNTNFIEELKQDTTSDPEEDPDCSRWKK